MAEDLYACLLCTKTIKDQIVIVKEKGLKKIYESSLKREDGISAKLEGLRELSVHVKCRKSYINDNMINAWVRKKRLCEEEAMFDLPPNLFFFNKNAPDNFIVSDNENPLDFRSSVVTRNMKMAQSKQSVSGNALQREDSLDASDIASDNENALEFQSPIFTPNKKMAQAKESVSGNALQREDSLDRSDIAWDNENSLEFKSPVYTPNKKMAQTKESVSGITLQRKKTNVSMPSTSRKETTPPRVSGSHRESHRDSRSQGKSHRESNYSTQPKRIRTVESPMHFNNQTAEDYPQTPINEGQLQRELLTLARDLIKDPKEESDVITRGWSIRLNRMKPIQRVFAEKFINDILFEGELGTLHRNAVRIVPEPSAKHGNSNGNSSSSDG